MSIEQITSTLWTRRLTFAVVFVGSMVAVVAATVLIPKTYSATATLVAGPQERTLDSFEAEQLTRTYTTLANVRSTSTDVAAALGDVTPQELEGMVAFAPVERTQLIEITAEAGAPERAAVIANTYARVFSNEMQERFDAGEAPAPVAFGDPAVAESGPIRPDPPLYIGFGLVLAALLAAAAALLRDRVDRTLRVAPEDESVVGQPVLARIPGLPNASGSSREVGDALRALRADALRVLRTNLDLAGPSPARVVLITSPGAGEGKTTIASQLAMTVATDRERVVLMECDLRQHPNLGRRRAHARVFGRRPGLSEYLSGEASREEILRPDPSLPTLGVISAGAWRQQPGALLRSPALATLIQSLREQNDWLIIDAPPISIGDDASILSSYAEGTAIVVDTRQTTLPALRAGIHQLEKVRARILGVVVNNVPLREIGAYDYIATYGVGATKLAEVRGRRQADDR